MSDGLAKRQTGGGFAQAASIRFIKEGTAPTSGDGATPIEFDNTNTDETSVIGAGFQSEAALGGAAIDEDITLVLQGRIRLRDRENDQWIESAWVDLKTVTLTAGAAFSMTRIPLSDNILWPNQFRVTWVSSGESPGASSLIAFVAG